MIKFLRKLFRLYAKRFVVGKWYKSDSYSACFALPRRCIEVLKSGRARFAANASANDGDGPSYEWFNDGSFYAVPKPKGAKA